MEPCCQQPENREVVEHRDKIIVQQCKVCGRKHYELMVDPVQVGVKGTGL